MSTFSLLKMSLDQTIDRESLEEASDAAPSVARADCAGIQRNRSGILVSGLPLEEANAFQAALKQRGFATAVVADQEMPVLHEAFTIQRIDFNKEALLFTDMMGREQSRLMKDLVFVAGGFMTQSRLKTVLVMEANSPERPKELHHLARLEQRHRFEEVPEFRFDFFFWSSPNRLRASVSAESTVFFRGRPVRLRDTALLLGAMMDLQELLPPERVGSGLKRTDTKNAYPSLRSYEEEIRWHFHRLES
jgi:hypothetical protein